MRSSSGGLVSAITSYLEHSGRGGFADTVWLGVPGCTEKAWDAAVAQQNSTAYTYSPVFVHWKKYEMYYNGFSNSVLWPLFHYFPSYADYNSTYFDAYMEVNRQFADALTGQLSAGDVVWIHDYHLLPLAAMLRKQFPGITIGFFLHIPFPSFELFRVIPREWQKEILTGMLGADLIGFHTADYVAHFLSCAEHILDVTHDGQNISWENRQVRTDAFPISIDYNLFHSAYDLPDVAQKRAEFSQQCGNRKLIFSVDRLDYTKGISNRLKGYEQFLKDHPEYKGNVVFILVIVPSRDGIARYAERKRMIDEYIGSINSQLGTISWQPVIYQYAHLSFAELCGLYTACDVALITPIRDGMNLVSKEFAASRKDGRGVLVLSELAGAAAELSDALLINPNDIREIANQIYAGLTMEPEEQQLRMEKMQARIRQYDVVQWSADFFFRLYETKYSQQQVEVRMLESTTRVMLTDRYAAALKRIILLDYDGTLMPLQKFPSQAVPSDEIIYLLEEITKDPMNDVYIISGRDADTLHKWLGKLEIGLIAEHGARARKNKEEWVNFDGSDTVSTAHIEKIMQDYTQRTPRSFIEKKQFSLAWHYRNVDLKLGAIRARELYGHLVKQVSGLPLSVLNGNKVIEVKPDFVNKGKVVERLVSGGDYDFILCIGDDTTDEDMFRQLAGIEHAFTIKVGTEPSLAVYNVRSTEAVLALLQDMALSSARIHQFN